MANSTEQKRLALCEADWMQTKSGEFLQEGRRTQVRAIKARNDNKTQVKPIEPSNGGKNNLNRKYNFESAKRV